MRRYAPSLLILVLVLTGAGVDSAPATRAKEKRVDSASAALPLEPKASAKRKKCQAVKVPRALARSKQPRGALRRAAFDRRRAVAVRRSQRRHQRCFGNKTPFRGKRRGHRVPFSGGGQPPAPDQYLPWASGASRLVTQGNNSYTFGSHRPDDALTRWGWDFALADGEAVHASVGGEVIATEDTCPRTPSLPSPAAQCGNGFGNYVLVRLADGTCSRYAHLVNVNVTLNQRIGRYHVLGGAGSSGYSFGTHLHYQREECNGNSIPAQFFEPNVVEDARPVSANRAELPVPPAPLGPQPGQEFVSDEAVGGFSRAGGVWTQTSGGGAFGESYWYMWNWLPCRGDPARGSASWTLPLPEGVYDVYAFIPDGVPRDAAALGARYTIHNRDGVATTVQDQHWADYNGGGWMYLARLGFRGTGRVDLSDEDVQREADNQGPERPCDRKYRKFMVADAVKWVYRGP